LTEVRAATRRDAGAVARRIEEWLKSRLPGGITIREHAEIAPVLKKMKPFPMRSGDCGTACVNLKRTSIV
jgi:hypothetical protein